MILEKAPEKLKRFNRYCLHYNLVAEAAYKKLKQADSPFNVEYRPYIIAVLISFDMGRMMGRGLAQKYDAEQGGFASKLDRKMKAIQPDIEPLAVSSIANFDLGEASQSIKRSYVTLSKKGINGLHSGGKDFHVGATKILHFINPELFPIVDSNAAKTLRALFGSPYKNSTQPGYSADLYLRAILAVQEAVSEYGIEKFQSLEPETPIMRIFDKLTFAFGNGW